ncbi:MAG: hypothetical protein AAFQ27_04100, partial [Pseudomonadota bacterium]
MFAAIFSRAQSPPVGELADGATLVSALAPFSQPDAKGEWQSEKALIVQAVWHNTPESLQEIAPEVCA